MKVRSRLLLVALSCTLLAACVIPPVERPRHYLRGHFDAALAQRLLAEGVNSIRGNAFMRQRGGGVVTCAGSTVYLMPATEYTTERLGVLYRFQDDKGFNGGIDLQFTPDPPEYLALVRRTVCDAQGNFSFDRVADGTFYVQTTVAWMAGNSRQGGNLIHRVTVKNGELRSIVLSA